MSEFLDDYKQTLIQSPETWYTKADFKDNSGLSGSDFNIQNIRYYLMEKSKLAHKHKNWVIKGKVVNPYMWDALFYDNLIEWLNELLLIKDAAREYTIVKSNSFCGDILITDPCYIMVDDWGWSKSNYGFNLSALGINNYISSSTIFGDWSCTVWKASNITECLSKNKLGVFCADAGMVSVMDYNAVLLYNPKIKSFIKECPHCCTVIKDFYGTVEIRKYKELVNSESLGTYESNYIELYGISENGNNFIAYQTGY